MVAISKKPLNLLPGPVSVSPQVKKAYGEPPVSHRSQAFLERFNNVKRLLLSLTGAGGVEILMGSGTLGNDAVAAQLSLIRGSGVILSNGEFGERLFDHARRFGLSFEQVEFGWGESFDPKRIEEPLCRERDIKWLWAVHSETSTGVLNNIEELRP